ncbi:MAG TPA: ribosomal protein S18-alanine N-acetyltransferase [Chloroflexota bacterium]|nr:ribosomal protein S18-alanine N-acetyltransferase [Chloroflexota bacterium]
MQIEDIPAVMEVERQSFTVPWPSHAYKRELKENRLARYIVARRTFPGPDIFGNRQAEGESDGVVTHSTTRRGLLGWISDLMGGNGQPSASVGERAQRVVGYAGLWLMVDEAHITSIAVASAYRGLGIGELLFLSLVDMSRQIGAQYVTLEVRVSNILAQNLYRKFGFKETGVRRRYYSDNNEDALIMWSDPLDSPDFQHMVEQHRQALMARLKSSQTVSELRARGVQA